MPSCLGRELLSRPGREYAVSPTPELGCCVRSAQGHLPSALALRSCRLAQPETSSSAVQPASFNLLQSPSPLFTSLPTKKRKGSPRAQVHASMLLPRKPILFLLLPLLLALAAAPFTSANRGVNADYKMPALQHDPISAAEAARLGRELRPFVPEWPSSGGCVALGRLALRGGPGPSRTSREWGVSRVLRACTGSNAMDMEE